MAQCAGDELAYGEGKIIGLLRGHDQLVSGAIAARFDLKVAKFAALHRDVAGDIRDLDAVYIFVPGLIFLKPPRHIIAEKDADSR